MLFSLLEAYLQVLEGALEGTKSLLEASEKEKLSLEAQIQQLMVEAERNEAENKKKVEDLQKQLANSGLSPKSPTETEDKSELAGLRLELLNKMVSSLDYIYKTKIWVKYGLDITLYNQFVDRLQITFVVVLAIHKKLCN